MELRYYQRNAIDSLYRYFETNDGNPLIVLPTGTGKSLVIAKLIEEAVAAWPDTRFIVATHVKELVSQNYSEFVNLMPFSSVGIYSAGLNRRDRDSQIIFAGIQSIYNKADKFKNCDLLIIDECFIGDTLIDTEYGPQKIKKIKAGDFVKTAIGYCEVKSTFKKNVKKTLTIRLSNGKEIKCTEDHPFFTKSGWIPARSLDIGSCIFGEEELSNLWKDFYTNSRKVHNERTSFQCANLLQQILFKEIEKPYAREIIKGKNEIDINKDWSQAKTKGGEWNWDDRNSKEGARIVRKRVEGGIFCPNLKRPQEWNISQPLQNRFGQSTKENSFRVRWFFARLFEKKRNGCKERQTTKRTWVESIKAEKSRNGEVVYNLRVSGHPSYFANGVLVHNCHTIPQDGAGMWRTFIDEIHKINPKMKIIGLTATDYRLDSGLLTTGENAIFNDVCYEYNLLQAIKDGYLVPIIPKNMATRYELDNVKTLGGDYKRDELEAAMDVDEKTRAAIDEIEIYGANRKSWLIFAAGNNHAKNIHEELKKRGYSGAVVTQETNKDDRARAVDDIRSGKIRYLVNNRIFTTGFNAKNIDLIADLAPTKSAGLHVQKLGRGTRCIGADINESIINGKENCLLLDYARNVDYHGPLDKIKGKDKNKGEGDAPVKVCPGVLPNDNPCAQVLFAGIRKCYFCGYEFEKEGPDIRDHGGESAVLSNQVEPEWHDVLDVYYSKHEKPGKPPSLKVVYITMAQRFYEFLFFEHKGYAREKSLPWWNKNTDGNLCNGLDEYMEFKKMGLPSSIDDALKYKHVFKKPKSILVEPDGKYWRVIGRDFEESTNEPIQNATDIVEEVIW